jgi:MFS family permease
VIIALIVHEFPKPDERAKAMSAYIFVAVGGGSIGLLAGGILTQVINWHWIFLVNLPIGAATLVLGKALIRENEGLGLGQRVDVLGSILVTVALMLGIYAIVEATSYGWASGQTLGFGGVALALLAAFFVLEARLANPIMPLRILRLRSLTGSSIVRGCLATGMYATFFLGALYLEHVLGYSPVRTGLAFLPLTLVVGALSAGTTARLVTRFGPKRVLGPGMLATIAALLLMARAGDHAAYFSGLFPALVLFGIGAGTSFIALLTIAMADVPNADAGLASGIVNVSMQMTAAIGLAVLSTIATNRTKSLSAAGSSLPAALTGGYHLAFLISAAFVALGALVAPILLRGPRPGDAEEASEPSPPPGRELEPA